MLLSEKRTICNEMTSFFPLLYQKSFAAAKTHFKFTFQQLFPLQETVVKIIKRFICEQKRDASPSEQQTIEDEGPDVKCECESSSRFSSPSSLLLTPLSDSHVCFVSIHDEWSDAGFASSLMSSDADDLIPVTFGQLCTCDTGEHVVCSLESGHRSLPGTTEKGQRSVRSSERYENDCCCPQI